MTAVLDSRPSVDVAADGLLLEVAGVADAAPGVRSVTPRRPDGGLMPGHPPGSHPVLACGDRRNACPHLDGDLDGSR